MTNTTNNQTTTNEVVQDIQNLETPVKRVMNLIGELKTKEVFNADAEKAYGILVSFVNDRIQALKDITNGESNKASDNLENAKKDMVDAVEETEEKNSAISNFFSVIGKAIKAIAGAVLGIAKFSALLIGCTGLVLARTARTACREVKSAFNHIANEYRTDTTSEESNNKKDEVIVDDVRFEEIVVDTQEETKEKPKSNTTKIDPRTIKLLNLLAMYQGTKEEDDEISNLASDVLIEEINERCFTSISLITQVGYEVYSGEEDSFGWLTGVIYIPRLKKEIYFG